MGTIFGFDLGTTSVGFAVVEQDASGEPNSVLWMGTRAFEETRAGRKLETKNKERRMARLTRRQVRRRKWRRIALGKALAEACLLPGYGTPDWRQVMLADPYLLRARGLDEALAPFELGRALYHLAQRRGFRFPTPEEKDEREGEEEAEKERGVVREGIATLRAQMGERTLGAHLAAQPRKRGKHIHIGRDMVEAEFEAIWEAQARHDSGRLTAAWRERLRAIIFHQRPTFWRRKTLGVCGLMPGEPLCPRGSWIGQQFVMLKELNNLRLVSPEARDLTPGERRLALEAMRERAVATYGAIRKAAGLRRSAFNYERSGIKHLHGNATEEALRKALGESWDALPARDRIRREITARLWRINYREVGNTRIEIRGDAGRPAERARFIAEAQADFGLSEGQAAALAEIHLPPGWLRFSEAAVARLVPHLEAGLDEYGAIAAEFPQRHAPAPGSAETLPSRPQELPDLRNPTVTRTINELRKVTNNLIRKFGKPDLIRIELARELKQPAAVRLRVKRDNDARERERERAVKELRERGRPVTGLNIDKWLLWRECAETSLYTGDRIGFEALFDRGEFEVDHIFPRSRSFDNSMGNKVLCEVEINRGKGERTPFEYLRDTGGDWKEFRQRVKTLKLPPAKQRRLFTEQLEEALSEELAERQLRDTSYAAVAARQFLEKLGVPVEPSGGRVTSELAYRWGLYGAAFDRNRKDRDDLRHHAVDALAVALTTRAAVKRLSDFHARARLGKPPELPVPWPNLWQEAREWAERMVVSHRVQRKVSGPLHAENPWRLIGPDTEDPTSNRYGVRKPVEQVSAKELKDIPDKTVRGYVAAIQEAKGDQTAVPAPAFPAPRRTRLHLKRQPRAVVPLRPDGRVVADKSDNHHMAVYGREGRCETYRIVTMFEAVSRKAAGGPVVRPWIEAEDGARLPLLCSLARGDLLELAEAADTPRYAVVRGVWDNGQVELAEHRSAQRDIWSRPNVTSVFGRLGGKKVSVDPIGRVRKTRD